MSDLTFEQWFEQLKARFESIGMPHYIKATANDESWKQYFNNGYSPDDAAREDLSYAD